MLRKAISRLITVVADAVYPPRCPLCDAFQPGRDAPCPDCAVLLRTLTADALLAPAIAAKLERCRSCFAYEGRIVDALHGFKYRERLDLLRYLGRSLAEEARRMGDVDLVLPVPLHPRRLRERGFNQAALLARRMGGQVGAVVELDLLARVRDIPPQVGLAREERIANVRGAFAVRAPYASRVAGRRLLLIDDVMTTGATLAECARALADAGAASVSALTVARALSFRPGIRGEKMPKLFEAVIDNGELPERGFV